MRSIDNQTAMLAQAYWSGERPEGRVLCPLLADIDKFLQHLDSIDQQPGMAINPCPECGGEHRWVLLSALLQSALDFRAANTTKLLAWKDRAIEPARALYGGREKYDEMRREAAEFFARLTSKAPGEPQNFYSVGVPLAKRTPPNDEK